MLLFFFLTTHLLICATNLIIHMFSYAFPLMNLNLALVLIPFSSSYHHQQCVHCHSFFYYFMVVVLATVFVIEIVAVVIMLIIESLIVALAVVFFVVVVAFGEEGRNPCRHVKPCLRWSLGLGGLGDCGKRSAI